MTSETDIAEGIADAVVERLTSAKLSSSVGLEWWSAMTALTAGWFNVTNSIVTANLEWTGPPNRDPSPAELADSAGGRTPANFTLPVSQPPVSANTKIQVFWTALTGTGVIFESGGPRAEEHEIPSEEVLVIDRLTGKRAEQGQNFIEIDGLQQGQLSITVDPTAVGIRESAVVLNGRLFVMIDTGDKWVQYDDGTYQVTIGPGENTT